MYTGGYFFRGHSVCVCVCVCLGNRSGTSRRVKVELKAINSRLYRRTPDRPPSPTRV